MFENNETQVTETPPADNPVPAPEVSPVAEDAVAAPVLQPEVVYETSDSVSPGNLSTGLIPTERTRMRTHLESQHIRTIAAHDRIMAAIAARAEFMENVASKIEDQNTELINYHKRFGL